jgi:hypothetical protein
LPAALHFLTGFSIQNVTAMLTVDSYLNFIITYVLGFAALFQIPLILMIINTIKPIPPKKLLGFQRFVVLGAFILAAIISPTPDVTNQAILAVPIILMYQIGVLLVWLQNRTKRDNKTLADQPAPINRPLAQQTPVQPVTPVIPRPGTRTQPVMDVASPRARTAQPARPVQADVVRQASKLQPVARPDQRPLHRRPNSIDGMVPRGQQLPQTG